MTASQHDVTPRQPSRRLARRPVTAPLKRRRADADITTGSMIVRDTPEHPAVLVVDDRLVQRVAIQSMLEPLGVLVVVVDSGLAALRAVMALRFAVIVMDVQMPNMDGWETADLIRQRRESSRTPIIFLTAFAPENDRASLVGHESGAIDFISTPLVPEVLRAKVSGFVDLFLQSEELQRSLQSVATLSAALRDSQASTQAVIESVADGIVTVEDGLIESFNLAAQVLFGYRADEVIGQPMTRLIALARRDEFGELASAPRRPAVGVAPTTSIDTLGCRRDGSTFPINVEHRVISLGGRTLTLAFVRDIKVTQMLV